ncbi:MAG TPA: preprotein translocase subunit SecG, partial [Anaeromyxobacteraceae bacterium]|nr:preprotein translocase subunit SecG [Anaeromyxobacteraceae bacterium]
MITLVTVVHVLVCVFLILVILLQAGKGGGMGAALGGGGSQTVFGGRGAQTFLGKVTSVSAAIFMLTSLTLAYHASKTTSVVERVPAAPSAPAPLLPPPAPAPGQAPAQPAPAT